MKITNCKKWLLYIIILLPVLAFAQTSLRSEKFPQKDQKQTVNEGVILTKGPSNIEEDELWIHYDDVENYDSWGFLISGEEYDVVAKWDPADISNYDGWEITKIKFIVVNDEPLFKVKVWTGPNANEIYSQDVDAINVSSWTEVILDTPVEIDASTELWVGYYVDYTASELGGFVTATDDGPAVDGYGNLYRLNGTWYSDFVYNHNLQVYIESVLAADFEAEPTELCFGSDVNFTNLSTGADSYLWTFEGGTPATSTEENPVVTYDTPGFYDVTLEVSNATETVTETKTEYIAVLETPGQASAPDGESSVCTDQFINYTVEEVLYAQDYDWELSPEEAGTLTPVDNTASFEVASDWTGDFTIRVRATNMCGDGEWSDYLEGTVYQSPSVFNLEGDGGYCLDGEGAEITLDNSEEGIEYELYNDEIATGNIVEGTGSGISFGFITEEGNYTAVAFNDNCETLMNNQVEVLILFPPTEPGTPEGPEVICEETSSDYSSSGSDEADSYVWLISPEDAGTITGDGLTSTVEWNTEYSGIAMISLYGINECGEGNPSNTLEVSVGAPNPIIEGEEMVCDWSEEVYEVAENEGSTYAWEITGGSISDGQGTYMVTVSWEGEGNGSLLVSEETVDGCEGDSELFEVVIDDCTGIGENNPENQLSVSPNPINGDHITVYTGTTNPVKIQLLSVKGAVMNEVLTSGLSSKVSIADFPKGIYLLKATYDHGSETVIKFIKN